MIPFVTQLLHEGEAYAVTSMRYGEVNAQRLWIITVVPPKRGHSFKGRGTTLESAMLDAYEALRRGKEEGLIE